MRFPNNNQAVVKELAVSYYKENGRRNKILIFTAAIAVFLIYASFSIASGKLYADYLIDARGMGTVACASLENGSAVQYDQLKEFDYIKSVGIKKNAASASCRSWSGNLVYLDEEAYEKMMKPAYTDITGHYPQKEDEIMLSAGGLTRLGIQNPEIGTKITLTTEGADGDEKTYIFFLSGYFTDYTESVLDKPEAYVSLEYLNNREIPVFPSDKILVIQEDTKAILSIEDLLYRDLSMEYEAQQVFGENPMVMQRVQGMFGSVVIAAGSAVIVLLCAFMLIYNVYAISTGKVIRQFGLLKTLGTTNRQLRKILYRQTARILARGILIGGTAAVLLVKLFLTQVLSGLFMRGYGPCDVSSFYPLYLAAAICLTSATAGIAARMTLRWVERRSAVEAMRYTEADVSYKAGRTQNSDDITLSSMAWRNIRRSGKRLCITGLSLFLGCLTALGSVVILRGTDTTNEILSQPDFKTGILTGIFRFPEKVPCEINDDTPVLTSRLLNTILGIEGIKTETVRLTKGSYAMIDFSEDEALFPRKKSLESAAEGLAFATLQILNDEELAELEAYVQNYDLPADMESLRVGSGTVLLHHQELSQILADEAAQKIGMPVHFYSLNANASAKAEDYLAGELSCAGYLDMTDPYFPDLQTTSLGNQINYFVMSEEAFRKLGFSEKYFDLSFHVESDEEPYIYQKLFGMIQLENQSGGSVDTLYLTAASEERKTRNAEIRTANLILGMLSAILLFAGAANYFNTLCTGLTVRAKEFAVMESLGLTRIQLRNMLLLEGIYYWGIIMTGILTAGSGLLWITGSMIRKKLLYFRFLYPWKEMALLSAILLLLCICISVFICQKCRDESVAERLKRYED